jgi:hypothetical protein
MRTDAAFANRIAALQVANLSDAQVQAFAEASLEIAPITAGLANATPEQRDQATQQIRAILDRHGIDGAAYNAIARRAQTDQALAARIAAAQTAAQSQGS